MTIADLEDSLISCRAASENQLATIRRKNEYITVLEAENAEIKKYINYVVAQEFDNICWMDVYTKLSQFVGRAFDPKLLPKETMIHNCEKFIDCLLEKKTYVTDPVYQNAVSRLLLAKQVGLEEVYGEITNLTSGEEIQSRYDEDIDLIINQYALEHGYDSKPDGQ